MHRRREFAATFDDAAERYHQVRPRYPAALFDALCKLSGATAAASVLEVGAATGVATEELARRFGHIVAVEPGPALAEAARSTLTDVVNVEVIENTLEDWAPPAWGSFDLIAAATSWHWIDPTVRYELAHRHLRPGGSLAFWSALHVAGRDSFFTDVQDLYDRAGAASPERGQLPEPGQLLDERPEIDATGLFSTIDVRHFDWEISYSADEYIALLSTFSNHLAMRPARRDTLFAEIGERIRARPAGLVHRHWGAALHVARAMS